MDCGIDIQGPSWLLQLDFRVKFKNVSCALGQVCVEEQFRNQVLNTSSKLHQVLKNGKFAQLLSKVGKKQGLVPLPTQNSLLYEFSHSSRRLLQTTTTADTRSRELIILQIAVLLGLRQISFATLQSLGDLMSSVSQKLCSLPNFDLWVSKVKYSTLGALSDLTPRLSSIASADAIKEQQKILSFLSSVLDRLAVLQECPDQGIQDIIDVTSIILGVAFCSVVQVRDASSAIDWAGVAMKLDCLNENLQDATYPLVDRLTYIQARALANKTGMFVTECKKAKLSPSNLLLPLQPILVDTDIPISIVPQDGSLSPVVSSWMRSTNRQITVKPAHLDAAGNWVVPGIDVTFVVMQNNLSCSSSICNEYTYVTISSYEPRLSPFAPFEPSYPSSSPFVDDLNPFIGDLLTEVHILKMDGGPWEEWRKGGTLSVQAYFAQIRTNSDSLTNDVTVTTCVQFVQNTTRWTDQGCRCLDAVCQQCNCTYATFNTGGSSNVTSFQDFMSIAVRRRKWCASTFGVVCSGHGDCVSGACACNAGYAGQNCNSTCTDCNGHGICSPTDGRCVCDPGYAGVGCSIRPVVRFVVPLFSKPAGGITVSVIGEGFGKTDPTPEIKIGNSFCRSSTWQSPTMIHCMLAPGVGEMQVVSIFAGGVSDSTGGMDSLLFSYSAPVITGLERQGGPTTGRYVLTIYGANFGIHWNEKVPFDGKVKMNLTLCSPSQWISDSTLRCAVPPGQSRNVPVLVEIPADEPRDKCDGFYIGQTTKIEDPRAVRCGICQGCYVFNYDAPVIQRLAAGVNKAPETYLFRGGEVLTIFGSNFGFDAAVAIGPDPNTGETYYCDFQRTFVVNTFECPNAECLFCKLGPGGGAYPITVWLAGQKSQYDIPFKFRGRAVGLKFQETPSLTATLAGVIEKQPRLKVIDDLDDNQPLLRPSTDYNFYYWVGPPGTFQEYNPDGYICHVDISLLPDPSKPFPDPCTPQWEAIIQQDPSKVGGGEKRDSRDANGEKTGGHVSLLREGPAPEPQLQERDRSAG
eukprot:767700-Hanusia_phi.AAC.3